MHKYFPLFLSCLSGVDVPLSFLNLCVFIPISFYYSRNWFIVKPEEKGRWYLQNQQICIKRDSKRKTTWPSTCQALHICGCGRHTAIIFKFWIQIQRCHICWCHLLVIHGYCGGWVVCPETTRSPELDLLSINIFPGLVLFIKKKPYTFTQLTWDCFFYADR